MKGIKTMNQYTQQDFEALERNADGYTVCEFEGTLRLDYNFFLDKVIFKNKITIFGGHIYNCVFPSGCQLRADYDGDVVGLVNSDSITIGNNNKFKNKCQFYNVTSYGDGNTFGNDCLFTGLWFDDDAREQETTFGNNNTFGERCRFENTKEFGSNCKFGDECYFNNGITFYECAFGNRELFDGYSKFSSCSFAEDCFFWKNCRFDDCSFGTYVMCKNCTID